MPFFLHLMDKLVLSLHLFWLWSLVFFSNRFFGCQEGVFLSEVLSDFGFRFRAIVGH
jgi:hypothetical protein